jgi:deoxyribonuclease-4
VAHDSYLINLASPGARPVGRRAGRQLPGASAQRPFRGHPGRTWERRLKDATVAASIDEARAQVPAPSASCSSRRSQAGTTLGRKFEELAGCEAWPGATAVCFDTCHVHAAGYDLTTGQGYEETFREFDAILGLESLRLFHVNDSKNERGSHVDRHEHIGKGKIGVDAFARLMSDSRFTAVPKILETPKGADGVVMDRRNLALLRRLAEEPQGGAEKRRRGGH